jgi:hypothetical protein
MKSARSAMIVSHAGCPSEITPASGKERIPFRSWIVNTGRRSYRLCQNRAAAILPIRAFPAHNSIRLCTRVATPWFVVQSQRQHRCRKNRCADPSLRSRSQGSPPVALLDRHRPAVRGASTQSDVSQSSLTRALIRIVWLCTHADEPLIWFKPKISYSWL